MKLLECIEKLKEIHERIGDVRVQVRNSEGEWDYVNEVAYTNIGIPSDPEWVLYIDV